MTIAPSAELVALHAAERTRDLLADSATQHLGAVYRFIAQWTEPWPIPNAAHLFACLAEEAEMSLRDLERQEDVVRTAQEAYRS